MPEDQRVWRSLAQLGGKLRLKWTINVDPFIYDEDDEDEAWEDSALAATLLALPASVELQLRLAYSPEHPLLEAAVGRLDRLPGLRW